MKAYHANGFVLFAYLLILFPNFSLRGLWSPGNELRRPAGTLTQKYKLIFNDSTSSPPISGNYVRTSYLYHASFAEATSRSFDRRSPKDRSVRKRTSPRRRFRAGRRLANKKKRAKDSAESPAKTEVRGDYNLSNERRKRFEAVLNEIKAFKRPDSEEACGIRWMRNTNTEASDKFQPHKTYGTPIDSPLQHDRNRRHVFDVNRDADPSVVYFSGRSIIHRTTPSFSLSRFTVELWIKPEGGQQDPAVVVAAGRSVSGDYVEIEWTLGIKSVGESEDRKHVFYFFAQGQKEGAIAVHSPNSYRPEEWTHLAVSSGHGTIRLYVNGVQVGARQDPNHEFSRRGVQCDTLMLGGNEKMSHGYRGMVDNLIVWSQARPQPDISEGMYNFKASHLPAEVVLEENFDNFGNWASAGEVTARKWIEEIPSRGHRVHFPEIRTPPCGQTVCDNPLIVKSYVENWRLRKPKSLRYNVVNLNDGEVGNPMFTIDDVMRQAALLKDVFDAHNITWIPSLVNINDSGLSRKTIGCEPTKIGNRQCNIECNHERMGHDGGDCDLDESLCQEHKKGDQHCDEECNKIYHDWDMGDCCDPRYTDTDQTCFDPASTHRAYLSVTEYKTAVGADNSNQLSVLFANWSNPNSIGISTFPWDKEVFTSQGGTIVQLRQYATREEISGLVHEMGHNLGLLHVHHGLHNVDCDDLCTELEASMTTGDLCEDTNPTPMNTLCDEPISTETMCSTHNFTETPYTNFMSYADGSCQDNFTPQQSARMHCYIDLFYGRWAEGQKLAPIPLAPKVVATSRSQRTITLSWAPPINGRLVGSAQLCNSGCSVGKRVSQFASSAISPGGSENSWTANQATGSPDQAACSLRGMHFWMPVWADTTFLECGTRCSIELGFKYTVIPSILRIWIPYGTEDGDGVKSIELLHDDNTITTITGLYATCDTPLSVHLDTNKPTRRIRIYVTYPFSAIDAVEMISKENDPECSGCRRIKYKIHRDPPFPNDLVMTTEQLDFTDRSCEEGVAYSYSIQPTLRHHHGELSPAVQFRLGQTFCGDGIVLDFDVNDRAEECDDGNTENEDGCDFSCHVEDGFQCKGEPSVCYWHEGDGICEEFENVANSPDCAEVQNGHLTQWVSEASSSSAALEAIYSGGDSQVCSSTREVLGPDDSTCSTENGAWSPCQIEGLTSAAGEHWLEVLYDIPVVPKSVSIYVATSARVGSLRQEVFSLLLPDGEIVSSNSVTVSCAENPIVLQIPHKAGRVKISDFVIKFGSADTAISAVGLTSTREHVDPHDPSSTSFECTLGENVRNSNVNCHITNSLSASASVGSVWPDRTKCSADCNPGYIPNYTQKVTCQNGVWNIDAKCIPISCGPPSHVLFASFLCQNGHKLNAVCNFTCWRQARMIGTENTFTCGEDGSWSTPTSYCEPMCGLPPNIAFASAMCDTVDRPSSRPGDTCKYRCKPGYHVTQQALIKRNFRLTCELDGAWKGPGCQPVLCPTLPTIYRGRYKCTRGAVFGSECTRSCRSSESQEVITCDSDGQWNATFSPCPGISTSCKYPTSLPGIETVCDGLNTGQTCRAGCVLKEGLSPLDIVATSDKPNMTPKPDPKTRVLVCTGESWFPNPSELHCVEPCDSQLIADKWCDAKNNRAYCNWDGGDCCSRTTRGRRVDRPKFSCESECDCKDPDAKENSSGMGKRSGNLHQRRRNRVLLSPLRAAPSAKISAAVANARRESDGRRHKKKRRRDRHDAIRTSRPEGDDSRRKHKHRRKHSGDSRRSRKKHRRYRG